MTDLFKLILGILASRFKARATLEAENLILNLKTFQRRDTLRSSFVQPVSIGLNYSWSKGVRT
jgi:hypothetical protein